MRGERLRQDQLHARGQRTYPLVSHGVFAGRQTTCGMDVETVPIDRPTPLFGSVFQNPKTRYFNANVTDELASLSKTWDFQLKRLIAVSRL